MKNGKQFSLAIEGGPPDPTYGLADRNGRGGSSRESAVYALYEFGIRCIIASSIADIHSSNCCKNGLLLVGLSEATFKN